MKNPVPAPTNEPGTCLLCGKKLKADYYSGGAMGVSIEDATELQLSGWPLIHWYKHDPVLNADVYQCSTYKTYARFVRGTEAQGLSAYNGSYRRRTQQGDNCFCSKVCAIQFARIAANMGFRLPSHTAVERKAAQEHARFLQEFAPYELEPDVLPPPDRRAGDWKCQSRCTTELVRNWTDFTKLREYVGPRQPSKSKRVRKPR